MSTSSDVDVPSADVGRSGAYIWFAVAGPIGIWMIHLIGVAAMTRIACTIPGWIWGIYGLTIATAAVTVVAMVMCESLRRAAPDDRSAPHGAGVGPDGAVVTAEGFANLEFLGKFGLLLGAGNLLLIVFEGSMAVWISACHY